MAAVLNLVPEPITFDSFWRAYPRRVARKNAQLAWAKINPSEYEKIMAAIVVHRRSEDWNREGGKFIPHPATWLNGERWYDEIPDAGSEFDGGI